GAESARQVLLQPLLVPASMGPPPGGRSRRERGEQWAQQDLLQWGRPRGGGVGLSRRVASLDRRLASMGPPPGGRSRNRVEMKLRCWVLCFNGAAPGGAESGAARQL